MKRIITAMASVVVVLAMALTIGACSSGAQLSNESPESSSHSAVESSSSSSAKAESSSAQSGSSSSSGSASAATHDEEAKARAEAEEAARAEAEERAKAEAAEAAEAARLETEAKARAEAEAATKHYVLNTNTRKFHYPTCSSVGKMKEANKQEIDATREEVIGMGYDPCGNCHP